MIQAHGNSKDDWQPPSSMAWDGLPSVDATSVRNALPVSHTFEGRADRVPMRVRRGRMVTVDMY